MDDDTVSAVPDEQPTTVPTTVAAESATLLPIAILETVLLRSGSWGVTEVAQALGLPKARIHRHLANLRAAGYLSQNPASRRYEPGWRLVVLGQRIQATAQVVRLARPVMTELRDRIGQTVVLSALTTDGVSVTDVVAGGSPIDVILSPGTALPLQQLRPGQGRSRLRVAATAGGLVDVDRRTAHSEDRARRDAALERSESHPRAGVGGSAGRNVSRRQRDRRSGVRSQQ